MRPSTSDFPWLELKLLLREAGNHFLTTLDSNAISRKADFDYVTSVDLTVQAILIEGLSRLTPNLPVLAEEAGCGQGLDRHRPHWILDPVDGTTNLLFKRRCSAISLGLFDGQAVSLGAIYDPYRQVCFWAQRGKGAWCEDQRLRVSTVTKPEEALIICHTGSKNKPRALAQMNLVTRIQQQVIDIRVSGSSALNLAAIAEGAGCGLVATQMQVWDYAAGWLLVEEAGGRVSDYQGNPLDGLHPAGVVAGSPVMQAWLLEQIHQAGGF